MNFLATAANLTLYFGQITVVVIAAALSPVIVRLLDVRSDFLTQPWPCQHIIVRRLAALDLLVIICYFLIATLNRVESGPVVVVIW